MFVTVDDAKLNLPFPVGDHGEHYWSSIHLRLNAPWFVVDFEIESDDKEYRTRSTILVMQFKEVLAIAESVKIIQIAIVSPSYMSDSAGWKMDLLKEGWLGSEPDMEGPETAILYVTDTGSRYVSSLLETPEAQLIGLHRIY